jgi:integrase
MTFAEAWPIWYKAKAQTISDKTQKCHREYIRRLLPFFGSLRLREITFEHIVTYREQRSATAGPRLINHEVNAVQQLLRVVDLWDPIQKRYKPMKFARGQSPGMRLTRDELVHLVETAQLKPRWRIAYLASIVMVQTATGPGEVLHIRLGDIDWDNHVLKIRGTKTNYRADELDINDNCLVALRELQAIAEEKGAYLPDHYLFPHRGNTGRSGPDPTRPMDSFKKAWESLRTEAAKKYPRLAHVRRYDLRHTALSEVMENPEIDEATARKIARHGPGSSIAYQTYFHVRHDRKKKAISVLNGLTQPKTETKPAAPMTGTWQFGTFKFGRTL